MRGRFVGMGGVRWLTVVSSCGVCEMISGNIHKKRTMEKKKNEVA